MNLSCVTAVRLVRAPRTERARGLLAFASFELNGVRVDGATVRRSRRGSVVLTYPCRRDRRGLEHPYVLPVDPSLRREVEQVVLSALGLREDAP